MHKVYTESDFVDHYWTGKQSFFYELTWNFGFDLIAGLLATPK